MILKYISKFVTAIAILLIVFALEVGWQKSWWHIKASEKYLILSPEPTWKVKGKSAKNEDEKMQLIEF